MNKSLGLVEVKGLALAIQTVDAMSKSANVEILGLERANGSGWTLIKVAGDVGSINAAVEIGRDIATKNNGLVSCKVIARSGQGLQQMLTDKPAEKAVAKAEPAPKSQPVANAQPTAKSQPAPAPEANQPAAKAKPVGKKAAAKKGGKA